MDQNDILKKFNDLSVQAENLELAMDIIALKPINFSEELKDMAVNVEEIKKLENEVNYFNFATLMTFKALQIHLIEFSSHLPSTIYIKIFNIKISNLPAERFDAGF
jgi:hypothetical protein